MASTFNYLGIELMATGENAGTWGTKTNTNLDIIQQASTGFHSQSLNLVASGANTTVLAIANGDATSATDSLTNSARNNIVKLTGAITGNKIVTIPNTINGANFERLYLFENGTTGSYTVEIKTASGATQTGATFSATDKGMKLMYCDGTQVYDTGFGAATGAAGANTQVQFNNNSAFGASANLVFDGTDTTMASAKVSDLTATRIVTAGTAGALEGDANLTWVAATALQIDAEKELRLGDAAGAEYVGFKAPATVSAAYTLTMPAATGSANQILVTNGSGVLSFTDNSGGTSWQTVKANSFTAAAGDGYFINTSGSGKTMTLPASPSLGDEVSFVDYAGTFDTYALTIGRNSQPIQGAASDLTVSIERAANTLVYVDGTQGWLLKTK